VPVCDCCDDGGLVGVGGGEGEKRGERVTMKHATALQPWRRATWRGVQPAASRAVGGQRVWLRTTANNLTSSTEAEGGEEGEAG